MMDEAAEPDQFQSHVGHDGLVTAQNVYSGTHHFHGQECAVIAIKTCYNAAQAT